MTVDEATPVVGVWPDNLDAVNAFVAMLTQWRVGINGPTGLDYGTIPTVLRIQRVERSKWPDVFEGLRVMEEAALVAMAAQRKK